MTSILQRLREKKEIIEELAKAGYFDEEEQEILRKLGLLGG
jgi:uncharacterized protein YutE (UPF0331/DUF86 family)